MTVKAAVTGAGGFLGWHMMTYLSTLAGYEAIAVDRAAFNDAEALAAAVAKADVVFHFAGANRGSDDDVSNTNRALAQRLADAVDTLGGKEPPMIVHASSIQAGNATAYGESKAAASQILKACCAAAGGKFIDLVLPHVFGECGRPDYNSVIATFCDRLARGAEPRIDSDDEIEPVNAQRLCEEIIDRVAGNDGGAAASEIRIRGKRLRVSAMLARLQAIADQYGDQVIPDLSDRFDLDLFNTYRSHLFPQYYPVHVTRNSDQRGWLAEGVRETNGGQVFVSETVPGATRGNHFHRFKVERFFVLSGRARIGIRRVGDSRVHRFEVSGDKPCFIDMPTLHTHDITNIGREPLLTLFWANEIFDPEMPDTYALPVDPASV